MKIPDNMRVVKILVAVALFAVGGIAVLLGLMWIDHTCSTPLPMPTGKFAIARRMRVLAIETKTLSVNSD